MVHSCTRGVKTPPLWFLITLFAFLAGPMRAQSELIQIQVDGASQRLIVELNGEPTVVRETAATILDPELRRVPGYPTRIVNWIESTPNHDRTDSYFAISLDGIRFSDARVADYELQLKHGVFDPLSGEPDLTPLLSSFPEDRLYVVQFWSQSLQEYFDILAGLGAEVHFYLPHHAFVVSMDAQIADRVKQQSFVRWVGRFHPAYKLQDELLQEQLRGWSEHGSQRVNLLTTRRGPIDQQVVAERVIAMGGQVDAVSEETHLMSVTVNLGGIAELARMEQVQWIDRWSPPETDMDIARQFHGADYVETVGSYTGQGVRVEVLDGGCDEGHPDLQNYIIHGGNSPGAHGTCTSGIVCGTGVGNPAARGVMPDSFLVIGDYNLLSGSRYNHTSELQDDNGPFRTVLQTNSWGSSRTTSYTSVSQDLDLILFDHERISILQSQSNAGNQQSRPQAWAKNIISVGGIRHFNTLSKSDDSWSGGASIGPAADGRIKPDLASFYDSTLCTDQVGSAGYTSSNYYSSFGGTSGATPIVAGHLGLIYQMWSDGVFGNPFTPGATVYQNRPRNTTAKALLINTATQWSFSGTNDDLTRTHQGWGHPDLQRAYDLRNKMFIVDEDEVLGNLATKAYALLVDSGTPDLKATLVYRDPPGTTSSSLHRINNLDLKLTSPSNVVYWGNNGLLGNMNSSPGGSPNSLDTVENVFIQNPEAGTWQIEVIASELNQDSHVETPALDADFALVVTGVTPGPPPAPVAEFVGAPTSGFAPLTVNFSDLSSGSIDTWSWSFGDGGGAGSASPSHTYTTPGTYTVSLTVSGPGGVDSETKSGYIVVNQLTPPASPSGLVASPLSTTEIDLAWNDNSTSESGFELERSPDGSSWALVATTGANVEGYVDSGLAANTTYHYRVRAFNTAGPSGYSNEAQATTLNGSTVEVVADADIPVSGSVSGGFTDTHADDGDYQVITEEESGGRPSRRRSFLEHKWTFDVAAGNSISFHVQAHQSVSSDGDNFVFAWSQDDGSYSDMLTVSKTSDDGTFQSAVLPSSLSGTIFVRVRDTDRTQGNRALDSVFVDQMFIRSEGAGGGQPPVAPSSLSAAGVSSSSMAVSWVDNSSAEDGYELERSLDGSSWSQIATLPANAESFTDTGLAASTTYFYRSRAFNAFGASPYSNVDSGTTAGSGTVDQVAVNETFVAGTTVGSYLNTHTNDGSYQAIRERESGGKKSNRYSFLEHRWNFNVQAGTSHTFFVKAYHSPNSEGDDFVLAYSVNGGAYQDMVTITKTVDDGSYQSFALPSGLNGSVTVRVLDLDQSQGARELDSVFIDHMFIRTQ